MGVMHRSLVVAILVAFAAACGSVVDDPGDGNTEFTDTGDGGGDVPGDPGDAPPEDARPESGREDVGAEDAPPEAEAGCTSAAECDDDNPCNGVEDCVGGECRGGTPPHEGEPCALESGEGICRGGVCAAPGCGDEIRTDPEECDDGNTVAGDGCEPDCVFSCHSNTDCADDNPCSTDSCEANEIGRICRHGLAEPGTACDDEDPCTVEDRCSATGVCGGEDRSCDDGNPCTVDSCDPSIPVAPCVHVALPWWYRDGDRDTWGVADGRVCAETSPGDDWAARAGDCCDSAAVANPAQTGWFGELYTCAGPSGSTTSSWDYDCSTVIEQHWPTAASGCLGTACGTCVCTPGWCGSSWWPDATGMCTGVPRCGDTAAYVVRCEWRDVVDPGPDGGTTDGGVTDIVITDVVPDDAGTGIRTCAPVIEMRRQLCH